MIKVARRVRSSMISSRSCRSDGVIGELEAMNLALKEEMEKVRAKQVDQLDTFLNTQCDLRGLLNEFFETNR